MVVGTLYSSVAHICSCALNYVPSINFVLVVDLLFVFLLVWMALMVTLSFLFKYRAHNFNQFKSLSLRKIICWRSLGVTYDLLLARACVTCMVQAKRCKRNESFIKP